MPSENLASPGDRPECEPVPIGGDVNRLLRNYRQRLAARTTDDEALSAESSEQLPPAVALGDIVRLKKPYAVGSKLYGQQGAVFTHGIVAEILDRMPDGRPRSVSLYLYSPRTRQIYLGPNDIPEFVDQTHTEYTLHKRATEMGYLPTDPNAPPDDDGG